PFKSFNDLEGPYISTPPRYIRAPIAANKHMVPIKIPIDKEICQTGTSSIPTRKNIIIGAKNGIKDVIVINFASGLLFYLPIYLLSQTTTFLYSLPLLTHLFAYRIRYQTPFYHLKRLDSLLIHSFQYLRNV